MLQIWHISRRMQLCCRLDTCKKLLSAQLCGLSLHDPTGSGCSYHYAQPFSTSTSLLSRDFYRVLKVSEKATADEIKEAYLLAAKKYHPDTASQLSASERYKFHEITEAYEVLGDKSKRIQYDMERRRRQNTSIGQRYANRVQQWTRRAESAEEKKPDSLYEQADESLHEAGSKRDSDSHSFLYFSCLIMLTVWFAAVFYFGIF